MVFSDSSLIALPLAVVESTTADGSIDLLLLLIGLFGGLAIFLLGMDRMTEALRIVAGDRLRTVLARLTTNRFLGMGTGAGVTAIIQSSSVTTVLVVGFVSAGLMTLAQAIGVILGANIGTTITAQIIAFKVTTYALGFVAVGFGVFFFSKNEIRASWGTIVMGLGLVFFGMSVMSDAMEPLRTYDPFLDLMAAMDTPILGIAVGAAFTALVQSSSATTGVVIALASQGLITLEAGIALVLGANVGTSVTAVLASIGKSVDARRASLAHTLFNVIGAAVWLPLVGWLASVVEGMGGGLPRQVANAHTLFNVANALVFIGFTSQLAKVVTRLIPEREHEALLEPKYLDRELLRTPSLALDRARLELLRMGDRVKSMLSDVRPALFDGPRQTLFDVAGRDEEVDALQGAIVAYLGEVGQRRLSERRSAELAGIMEATNSLESVGDVIETNLVGVGLRRMNENLTVSPETRSVLDEFAQEVAEALDMAVLALTQKNLQAARYVTTMKERINELEQDALAHQAARLAADAPDRVELYRLETDMIAHLKRIYYFAKRIARVAVPPEDRDEREELEG